MGGRLARRWRHVAVAMAIACVVGGFGTAPALAQQPDPQELWRAFPLDPEKETSGGTTARQPSAPAQPARAARPAASPPSSRLQEGTSSGQSWLVLFAAAVAGAAFVALVLAVHGRLSARRRAFRARSLAEAEFAALPEDLPWPPARPAGERASARAVDAADRPAKRSAREPERVTYRPGTRATFELPTRATFELPTRPQPPGPPAAAPPGPPAAAPLGPPVAAPPRVGRAQRPSGRALATSRNGPVCQVRWSRRGARFYAVTTDADGVEKRLARSPQFEWNELAPPTEDSREAQAALRQLAKELREKGWRPLRAKGFDFDDRQWYARRFRWPTDAERQKPDAKPPIGDAQRDRVPGRELGGRPPSGTRSPTGTRIV
jgi:hypothetical protein